MKKQILLLLLISALFAPLAAKAQTLTVHDGSVTNSYVPFYGYYADENQQNQMIYPATELSEMANKAITQMVFYWDEGEIYVSENNVGFWTVSLGETTATTLSALDLSTTLTEVFSGQLSAPHQFNTTNHTLTITFTNPYQYNGGNLLVQFVHVASDDLDDFVFYGEEVTGASFSYGASRNFLPKTTFSYSESECLMPSSATVSNISSTSASFNWTGGSGTYNVQYKKATDSEWTSRVANYNGYGVALTGLATNTDYQARVQSVCEGNTVSNWKTVSFTTLPGIPFLEEFTSNTIPTAWETHYGLLSDIMGGGTLEGNESDWHYGSTSNGVFDNHARINVYGVETQDWLITPNIPMESGVKLSFDLALTDYYGTLVAPETTGTDDRFVVLVTTDNCSTWTILREWNNTGSAYIYNNIAHTAYGQTEVIDLSNYSSGNIRIAFYAESTESNADNNLHLDNVSIDYCAKPANFTCTGTTNTSATFNWEGEANSWQIVLNDDFDHPYNTSTNPPYTITGLTPGTEYTAKIRAYAGYQHFSQWTHSISFITSFCAAEDQCQITYTLEDAVGDGWNDAAINVIDVASDITIAVITLEEGSSLNGTLNVCNGRELLFEWEYGYNDEECSYVFWDNNGDVIFQGSDEMEEDFEYTVNCTTTDCHKPTNLDVIDYVYPTSVTLMWEPGSADQDLWEIMLNDDEEHLITANSNPFTVSGLTPETEYTVRVRANCGEEQSHWSNETEFETAEVCPQPEITEITDIMPTSATLEWYGESDSYMVSYKDATPLEPLFAQDFESGMGDWTTVYTANTPGISSDAARSGNYGFMFSSFDNASSYDQYLISPELTVTGTLDFYYMNPQGEEVFKVGYSSTDNEIGSFTWGEEVVADAYDWEEYTEAIPAGTKYIAIWYYSYYKYYLYVDDIVIAATNPWQTVTSTENSANLNGLTPATTYQVKVQGFCEGNIVTEESYTETFTTPEKVFYVDGNWDVAGNWSPVGAPTATDNVTIMADAIVPSNCEAFANTITIDEGKSLTIKDGGKLVHNSAGTIVTIEKNITKYTGEKDRYYLISSIGSVNSTDVINMLTGNYDYYRFDCSQEGAEWRNYEAGTFNMATGMGYLYANDNNVTLKFTKALLNPQSYYYCGGSSSSYLKYDTSKPFGTFNLVGNAHVCKGYLYFSGSTRTPITDFYVMNAAGTEIVPNENPYLLPNQGAFINSTATNQRALISAVAPGRGDNSSLNMTIVSDEETMDVARLRFDKGNGLEKFQLNPSHTKLFIPQDGKDYAVVNAEASGEMPLNFKAEKNGSYTLSFNNENVEFGYLHLIDNMTGNDVNLLETPSYSFEARTTDYASRFRLVFATGSSTSSDTFAFNNGSEWIVANEGEATLQVIDILGRQLSSEKSHSEFRIPNSAFSTPGVYMLRLINGDNVRTQKIVVR